MAMDSSHAATAIAAITVIASRMERALKRVRCGVRPYRSSALPGGATIPPVLWGADFIAILSLGTLAVVNFVAGACPAVVGNAGCSGDIGVGPARRCSPAAV